jgi:hypothetical protein
MRQFIVKVTAEGQTWFIHERGERIGNSETAVRFDADKANELSAFYRKHWRAETEVVPID